MVPILLILTLVFSIAFISTPVLAQAIIDYPVGTIDVIQGETLTLSHRLLWDNPDWPGTYVVAIYWDYTGDNAWHFTVVENRAFFDTDGDNLPDPSVAPIEATLSTSDNGTRFSMGVSATTPDPRDGEFIVEITLRARGPDDTPHKAGDHVIEYSPIIVAELAPAMKTPAPITVRVPGPSVVVSISPSYQSGPPGATLEYIVTVKNTGTIKDNYSLTVTDNEDWGLLLSENWFKDVQPGENSTTMLSVTIPGNAVPGTEDNITVTATSQAGASDFDMCIAHAEKVRHWVEVSISPSYQSAPVGMTLSYTVIVRNTGNVVDNYSLSVDDNADPSWGPTLSDNLVDNRLENVQPGESRMLALSVTIPEVDPSTEDNITVTATSQGDNTVEDNASSIAHAIEREVEITISPSWQRGGPDDNIWGEYDFKYTVTVTNRSALPDNYTLTVNDTLGWDLRLVGSLLLEVPAEENRSTTLYVKVPAEAEPGTEDIIIVTATSWTDSRVTNRASCVAQSGVVAFEVSISPSRQSGIYLYDLEYLVWITNKGTLPDSYTVTVSDTLDWDLGLEFTQIVPAGENENVILYVGVPFDAKPDTEDKITVVATSRTDNTVSDNAISIARAARVDMEVTISPSYQRSSPGETLVYLLTVRNDGDIPTTYSLYADDNADPSWGPTLDDNKLTIPSGKSSTTKLRVRIPNNATHRTMDNLAILVSAAAQVVITVDKEVSSIAQAETLRLFISPSVDSARPGENLTFAVWVTNVGIENDNYNLTVSDDAGWGDNITLSENSLKDVEPGESRRVTLTITIPDAELGTEDNVMVTVIPKAGPAARESENCVAIAAPLRGVRVSISPKSQIGPGGATITYVVIVKNVGTENDSYDLDVDDDADPSWGDNITLSENLLVIPGLERRGTILEVTIPREAAAGTVDNVYITVTSRENVENVVARASCAAQIEIPAWIKRAIVRGDATAHNVDAGMEGDYPLEVLYSSGDYPPLMVAKRVENGAVVAAGLVSTCRGSRWEPDEPTGKLDVLLDMAFRWMKPDNTAPIKVLWYGEYEVGVRPDNENYYVENGVYNDAGEGKCKFLIQRLTARGYTMEDTMDGKITRITSSLLENYDILVIPELQLGGWGAKGGDTSLLPDNDVQAIENFVKGGGGLLIMEGTDSFNFNFCKIQNKILTGLGIEDVYFQSDGVYKNGVWAFNAEVTDVDFGADYREATGLTQVWVYSTCSLVVKPEKKELDVFIEFIPPSYLEGLPGETLTYTLTITNTGKRDDTYVLDAVDNAGFASSVLRSTMALAAGESDNVTLSVTIPEGTPRGMESRITIAVTSLGDPTLVDVAYGEAWTGALNISASIDPTSKSGLPGENLKFIVYVTNTGDFEDNYTLAVSDNAGWGPMLSRDNLTIPKDKKRFAILSVIIPENAASGAEDNITITVTSQTDNRVSTENSCIALVTPVEGGVDVSISPISKSGVPGEELNFDVTVTNTGTGTDTFSLTASDTEGWGPTLSITSIPSLAGGDSRTGIQLSVKIPDVAAEGDSTTITVTASGTGYEDSASCIARATAVRGVDVSISPESKTGSPGENVTFTVMVTNTGEVEDSYELTVSDNAGWGAVLSDNLLMVPADENRTTTVSVIVPSVAIEGESTVITVTATSRGDPTVSDTAKCTANAREKPGPPPIVPIGVGGAAIGGGIALTLLLKKGMISVPFLRSRRRSMFSSMDLGQSRPSKRSLLNPRPVRSNPARARRFSKKWL